MTTVEAIRDAQRTKGPASILAIGTATPPNFIYQKDYPDYYFRVTNSEHKTAMKAKFTRLCEKSMIRKRHFHLTEEIMEKNKNIGAYKAPSLDVRQNMLVVEVPKLGKEAALKALKEWGQPKSKITHLVFCSSSGVDMPGADYQLTKLLGLRSTVKRVMMNNLGCFAGGTGLRLSKDLAENNAGARVLLVCSENMAISFHGPSEAHLDILVGSALFGDGAAAVVVGADPNMSIERPLFQLVFAAQSIVPGSEGAIVGHLLEMGLTYYLSEKVPKFVAENIESNLIDAFAPIGIQDWNSIFWIVHPGGPAILDQVETNVGLEKDKLSASRHVLSEYGNMWGPCVLFVLDEMRKKSSEEGKTTTGEGFDWGICFAFGPGLTIETMVLHSIPIDAANTN